MGCHSAFIEATVDNQTSQPIRLIQVDYPSASFGAQAIAPGSSLHYRFKIIGSDKVKLTYTDAANKEHHEDGPELHEGEEGKLQIAVSDSSVHWDLQLRNSAKR